MAALKSGHFHLVGLLRDYCKRTRKTAELKQLLAEAQSSVGTQRPRKPTPARNELPSGIVQAIVSDYQLGSSLYRLAAHYHVRRNTIRDVLRRNGVQIAEGNTAKLSPEQKDAIRAKRIEGVTVRALCDQFEVSQSTIKRTLRRTGCLNSEQ